MSKDKTEQKDFNALIAEATKDILTEETQKELASLFEQKVNESVETKAELATETALIQMDAEYKKSLEALMESVDATNADKLKQLGEKIEAKMAKQDEQYAQKLVQVKEHYEKIINEDSKEFKKSLIESVSVFVKDNIEKAIPREQIREAVENKRAKKILEQIQKLVSVDSEFVHEDIKKAMVDGKRQIVESHKQVETLENQVKILSEKLEKANVEVLVESKCSKLPKEKAAHIKQVLSGKSSQYITENFDYVVKMYEKNEAKSLETIKESVKTKNIDTPKVAVQNTSKPVATRIDESVQVDAMDAYIADLEKPRW